MSLKSKMIRVKYKAMKQQQRQATIRREHLAQNMIRKMNQQIPLIKEYNQKNPKDMQIVPYGKIHKLMV